MSGGAVPARSPGVTIAAEIPYLRSELQTVQVEYESRILDERDGRAACDAGPGRSSCRGASVVGA